MERWRGKAALVTGASAGIGAAVATRLAARGVRVLGLGRRLHKLQEVEKLAREQGGELHVLECDLTKEEDILRAFQWASDNFGGIDVLINNAGLFYESLLSDGATDEWRQMLKVNVLALNVCTREFLRGLQRRSTHAGHIVHINSVGGHWVPSLPGAAAYAASKHAVTALTEGLRRELVKTGRAGIKVTAISPGLVKTEILDRGNLHSAASDTVFASHAHMLPEDIADAVEYVLSVPERVQIHDIILRPAGEEGF
ncbi:farnesol dehydrogenase-like [Schistocerca cancellata]|uniref:farnesol dehydrogenase-like n=1 Tax=Schistocerca cancellata TaxID=274614 RepID=UPI0021184C75|nr:farnesol dehydrogenase-like [Schistocerca cancellata]